MVPPSQRMAEVEVGQEQNLEVVDCSSGIAAAAELNLFRVVGQGIAVAVHEIPGEVVHAGVQV